MFGADAVLRHIDEELDVALVVQIKRTGFQCLAEVE